MKLANAGCVLSEADEAVNPKDGSRSQCAYVISLHVSDMGHGQLDPARCQDLP